MILGALFLMLLGNGFRTSGAFLDAAGRCRSKFCDTSIFSAQTGEAASAEQMSVPASNPVIFFFLVVIFRCMASVH